MEKIKTLNELKKEAKNGLDCFILLNGGLRSSKHIWYDEDADQFEVIHMIDGSEECLSSKEIMDPNYTNFAEAMEKGALIKD